MQNPILPGLIENVIFIGSETENSMEGLAFDMARSEFSGSTLTLPSSRLASVPGGPWWPVVARGGLWWTVAARGSSRFHGSLAVHVPGRKEQVYQ